MRSLLVTSVLVVAAAIAAGPASAEIIQRQDDAGRTITFDVQAGGASVDWYASLLRGALHGDEIERVTVRIVAPSAVRRECGPGAAACYSATRAGARIVVPAGSSTALALTLLHEYGHHVDASRRVSGVAEPNGTARWWRARRMGQLVSLGRVARDYGLGWERSIGEIFAEDYVQAHIAGAPYAIGWLSPPSSSVRSAIVRDLGGTPPTLELPEPEEVVPTPPEPGTSKDPIVVVRRGVVGPRETASLPFGLLGPGRRVEVVIGASGSSLSGPRLRATVVCGSRVVSRTTLTTGTRAASIDRSGVGPATCRVDVRNTAATPLTVSVRLRLSVPG